MSESLGYTIRLSVISISFATSFLTLTFILLRKFKDLSHLLKNKIMYHPLIKHPFALRIFLIQACYASMCLIDLFYTSDISPTRCKFAGALFSWFIVSAFLMLDYLLLTILLILNHKNDIVKKYNKLILFTLMLFPCYNFIMFNSFEQCGVNDFLFYCAICDQSQKWQLILVQINYFLPFAIGFIIFLYIIIFNCKKYSVFSTAEKFWFQTIYIPAISFVFILIEGILVANNDGKLKTDNYFFILVLADCLFFLAPVIDVLFCWFFINKFNDFSKTVWIWRREEDDVKDLDSGFFIEI